MSNIARFFMFFVILLVIACGVMWFIGGKKQEFSTEVSIDAPANRIFRYLVDPQLLKEWSNEIVQIETIDDDVLDAGQRNEEGALTELVVDRQGQQVVMRQEIIKLELDKMVSLQRSNDFMVSTAIFRLTENSPETVVSYRIKETHIGLRRITGFFLGNDRQDVIQDEIRQLKQLIESNLEKDLGALPEILLRPAPGVPNDKIGDGLSGLDGINLTPSNPEELLPSRTPSVQVNRPEEVFDDR